MSLGRALAVLTMLAAAPLPAAAEDWGALPPVDRAAVRVRDYLSTVPGLPANVVVVPAAGDIPWPGVAPATNVRAEVWLVVPRDKPDAAPLMMFAVRPATGEVYALYLSNLQAHPRYR